MTFARTKTSEHFPLKGGLLCQRRLIACCGGFVVALIALVGSGADAAITQVANGFQFTDANNNSILISNTNGSIVSITGSGGGVIATGGDSGLWSLTYSSNPNSTSTTSSTLNATAFSSGSNTFQSIMVSSSSLQLTYSDSGNTGITVTVTLSDRSDGLDVSAAVAVSPTSLNTVLGITLPAQLRFDPANLQRFIAPNHSSDGVGMAFTPSFFQIQTEDAPPSWNQLTVGDGGYDSLYGGTLSFPFPDYAFVPINFTTDGVNWLGTGLSTKWAGAAAIVNRPPAAGQADLVLLDSGNGAFFSGSHLGGSAGAGWLIRIGGAVDASSVPLSLDIVTAAIEHLAQTPAGRNKVGLLSMARGPVIGFDWPSAVTVDNWLSQLQGSTALASAGIQIVELTNVTEMMNAMAGTDYLAILNPYGELVPASLSGGVPATVASIGNYVHAGGNWFEVGGYPFYQALQPELYYRISLPYPPAFADFLQLETTSGNAAIYGVQPVPADPWSGQSDPTTLFIPGQLDWGGDAQGGYCERGFGIYVAPNQTWQSPVVRLSLGHSAADSIQAYSQANGFIRTLTDKMSPDVLAKFQQSVLVNYIGTCSQLTAYLPQLPSPALLHFAQYLYGGFDKQYPDHLPPNPSFGSPTDFQNFLAQARQGGMLTMPYTNPTFWGIDPQGPTFTADGWAPLLLNLDGSHSLETYFGNSGYTVTPWHPDARAASNSTVVQFTTTYPVDMLFEDQIGARTWQYDTNAASPTPYAYASGIAAIAAEHSQSLPVSTENGFDRLVNFESQFCGLAWGLAPTVNAPVWRRFLRDRYATWTWQIFPLAQIIAHDKLAMNYNDLNAPVTTDETIAWTMGLGYGMTYYLNATDLDLDATRQWLLWLDRLQKSVCARYTGEPVNSFSHQWGTQPVNPDNGVIQASYGPVSVVANLGAQNLVSGGNTIAPYGFTAMATGLMAAKIIPPGGPSAVSYVAQTNNGGGVDFWIYSLGTQNVTIVLPPGFNGPVTVQMDGASPIQPQVQSNALTVPLGAAASPTTSYLWHGTVVPFSYTTNPDSTIKIAGYAGPGGTVTIPSSIAGLTVTGIANYAFNGNTGLTSVTIPDSVTSIGQNAFYGNTSLTNVTLGSGVTSIGADAFQGCTSLTSITIPGSVTSIGNFAFYGCTALNDLTIGNGVATIGQGAFQACSGLTSVKIPASVTSIGIFAFSYSPALTSVYFLGNAPGADSSVFSNDPGLSAIYYLPGTAGWSNPWNNHATVLWNPAARNFTAQANQFGFTITGPDGLVLIVEGCDDLKNPDWVTLDTVTLTGGAAEFSDPGSSGHSSRFYRFRAP